MRVGRVGLDPEVAIVNRKTGLARSAHKFINKVKQFKFYYDSDTAKERGRVGSEIDRDGAAIEVRSVIRSACRDNIIPYVAEGLRQAQLLVEAKEGDDFVLSSAAKYELDAESLSGDFPSDIVEFGCRPDVDAYDLVEKDPFCEPGDTRRWTGGHLHASPLAQKASLQDAAGWAILYDYLVAGPMVAILGTKFGDGEAERRTMYGQPGSFRFEPDQRKIEFRTLSGRVLLHPTLLYWAVGAMKMMGLQTDDPMSLVKGLRKTFSTDDLYETVLLHDVERAEKLVDTIFKQLPQYKEDKGVLRNPVGGSGGGTYSPYFFEQAAKLFIEGNKRGITFEDDMKINWGLYEDYEPKHHAYWGLQVATAGACDDLIFPQNAMLADFWPAGRVQEKPIYTHPLNGGAKQYTTKAAAGWLA